MFISLLFYVVKCRKRTRNYSSLPDKDLSFTRMIGAALLYDALVSDIHFGYMNPNVIFAKGARA